MRWQATASDTPEIAACVHDDTATRKQHTACAIAGDLTTSIAAQRSARPERRQARIPERRNGSRRNSLRLVRWISHDPGCVRSWPPATSSSPRSTPPSWSTKSKKRSARSYCAPSGKPSTELQATSRRSRTRVHHHLRTPLRPIRILRMRNKWRERLCASSADSIGYPSMRRCDSTDGSH